MPRNIETREGYEFWDRLCRLQRYSFFLGSGPSVRKVEDGTGNWIEVYGAQSVMDDAQSEINVLREEKGRLEAEAQALREEVERGNRIAIAMALDIAAVGEVLGIPGEEQEGGTGEFIDLIRELQEQAAALRARVVVVPERMPRSSDISSIYLHSQGWNACLDELARLNGKAVSEGLLRRLLDTDGIDGKFDAQEHYAARQELKALLGEGKEHE